MKRLRYGQRKKDLIKPLIEVKEQCDKLRLGGERINERKRRIKQNKLPS